MYWFRLTSLKMNSSILISTSKYFNHCAQNKKDAPNSSSVFLLLTRNIDLIEIKKNRNSVETVEKISAV